MSDTETKPAESAPSRSFVQRLVAISGSDLIRVVVICVIVGLVLAAFQIDPRELWVDFFGTIGEVWGRFFSTLGDSISWAIRYFLLGAIIVVPIWILIRIIGAARRS